jgi:hypothetical protein
MKMEGKLEPIVLYGNAANTGTTLNTKRNLFYSELYQEYPAKSVNTFRYLH